MKLMTKALLKKLPPLETESRYAHVKYFTPWGNWTWYGVSYDPKEKMFFGLVEGFEKEWGYFSLTELESIRSIGGLKVERDLYWTGGEI